MNEAIPTITKLFASLAGMMGGISVSMFWMPENLKKKGDLIAGCLIGGMSAVTVFSLIGFAIRYLGISNDDADAIIGVGYLIGIPSVTILGLIAKTFEKRKDKDIVDIVKEARTVQQQASPRQRRKRAPKP
jgi:H+/gluconate symporter-like permease